ncbi:aminoglycoside phosphotransferase family protein [Oceanicoccus sp. KOV_DT_Chl]|uniref:aminoglycoside phosphotransferase family protein n=1 Tax=Oceanicoccus sp. KOV_DT_Chl TaxID=1904639 RepID=UPI0027152621|nr:phosphotransferase [Oceanicoccus sp. KOV_DT_Chl]
MSLPLKKLEVDQRQQLLEQWLAAQLGVELQGESAGSDAGFRRYFRYQHNGSSLIAMDAPPQQEDCCPFVRVAELLSNAGVQVPEILAADIEQGFLLLSDLGPQTYLDVMLNAGFEANRADDLFTDAIDALLKFQCSSEEGVLPEYDEALLRRELELFPEWYLQRHLGLTIDSDLRQLLDSLFDQLIAQVLAQSKTFVHRDYMPRNLMPAVNNGVGVLDFQDAVYGPISYDVASLFSDAFISWPQQKIEQWQQQYWQQAEQQGLPVPAQFADFQRDCDFMACQRHLKVIGIFARICHRDGKPRYLEDVPRFFTYLQSAVHRQPELQLLQELLQSIESSKHS